MVSLNLSGPDRQRIRDAALPIQLLRAQITPLVANGRADDVTVEIHTDRTRFLQWIHDRCAEAGELLAVSHRLGSLDRNLDSFHYNQELVGRGVRMLSLFDVTDLADDVADYIIGSDDMPYYFAYGPLPIKVFDRRSVMLEGPIIGDSASVMVVSRSDVTAAAMRYIKVVRDHAVPGRDHGMSVVRDLTQRQHAIARLLSDGLNDESIAESMGLSVRTVRHEVATLLSALGASTRFAAGARYARVAERDSAD